MTRQYRITITKKQLDEYFTSLPKLTNIISYQVTSRSLNEINLVFSASLERIKKLTLPKGVRIQPHIHEICPICETDGIVWCDDTAIHEEDESEHSCHHIVCRECKTDFDLDSTHISECNEHNEDPMLEFKELIAYRWNDYAKKRREKGNNRKL